ncbi:MAG TPA: rhodanese-like domain-containing protein [Alphaproteobacteria bacterium]|nr:rhodanese-like domain-containing protein [Alphaproteobacteria bacterium]
MTASEPNHPLPEENSSLGYAGDLDPIQAWELLSKERDSVLIDVRTSAEWNFIGLPDLSSVGKQPVTIEWQSLPGMARNPDFDKQVKQAMAQCNAGADSALIFICRSGARSRDAAISLAQQGFSRCYNLSGGFEGDLDAERHRGNKNGWKFKGLPWKQG